MPKKTPNPAQTPPPESPGPRGGRPYQGPASEPSLYRRNLGEKTAKAFDRALKIKSIDQELALLRVRVNSLLADDPHNSPLILKAIELVIRAYAAKARASGDPSAPTEEGIDNMLRGASEKFGLKIIPWESNC